MFVERRKTKRPRHSERSELLGRMDYGLTAVKVKNMGFRSTIRNRKRLIDSHLHSLIQRAVSRSPDLLTVRLLLFRRQDRFELGVVLLVEVLVQIGRIELDLGSAFGHIDFSRPQDRVDDDAAEVLIGPVAMEVPAGKAEAPAAV